MSLLEVGGLEVILDTPHGPARAVRGVGFALGRGETLGIVGESGCGKTMTALALMGLLPEGARVEGVVRFDGADLLAGSEIDWVETLGAASFQIRNPNAASSCGCGSSFSI